MKKLFSITILLSIACFPGCYEPTDLKGIPPQTTTGENTMGFLLNGQAIYNDYIENVNAVISFDVIDFGGHLKDGSSVSFGLLIPDPPVLHYTIDSAAKFNTAKYETEHGACRYGAGDRFTHPENVTTLEFTRFDASVVSGTFTMKLKAENCTDVEIISGRFDIKVDSPQ